MTRCFSTVLHALWMTLSENQPLEGEEGFASSHSDCIHRSFCSNGRQHVADAAQTKRDAILCCLCHFTLQKTGQVSVLQAIGWDTGSGNSRDFMESINHVCFFNRRLSELRNSMMECLNVCFQLPLSSWTCLFQTIEQCRLN